MLIGLIFFTAFFLLGYFNDTKISNSTLKLISIFIAFGVLILMVILAAQSKYFTLATVGLSPVMAGFGFYSGVKKKRKKDLAEKREIERNIEKPVEMKTIECKYCQSANLIPEDSIFIGLNTFICENCKKENTILS